MLLVAPLLKRTLLLCLLLVCALMCLAVPLFAQEEQGVCARVRIKISQEVAITRTAFRATLEITNSPQNVSLSNFKVTLDIRDANNQPANDLFGIKPPVLTNVGDVDGNGTIGPGVTATAVWTIIPTRDAAPEVDTKYTIGGKLSYTEDNEPINAPLFPATIWVKPDARLILNYFLVRDVYSDDPFTPQIEPSQSFPLGLILSNQGKGAANNVRITSSQPQIVDNEKGLLIDFKIIGAQVNTDPVSPSLTVNLGNIPPGQTSVAQWMMTSSLQGRFIEYKATFEHLDGLGDPRLSLIDSVTLHELTHAVRVDVPSDDLKPDFLVNDNSDEGANPNHLPNHLYNSDGAIEDVAQGLFPSVNGTLTPSTLAVSLTATTAPGWTYIRTDDPGQERYRLARVVRSDGREIRVDENAWTTHKTVRLVGQPVYREHKLHLFDKDSTGSYTLFYEVYSSGTTTMGDAKAMADGMPVTLGGNEGLAVTALFPDCIYVESLDRTSGMRLTGASAFEGDRISVTGATATAPNGEREIVATSITKVGSGALQPLGVNLRALQCGDFQYDSATGAGQQGMAGGSGLNVVGLFIRVAGKVVSANATDFTIGAEGQPNAETYPVKVILPDGVQPPAVGLFVRVTGVVSTEKDGASLHPVIRVRRPDDVFAYNVGPQITDLHVEHILSSSCDIVWTTDIQSTSVVMLGTEPGVYTKTVNGPDFVTGHTVHVSGLAPGTHYYYVAQSTNYWNGVMSTSAEQEFTTAGLILPELDLSFPTATLSEGVITASARLANTGGDAAELKVTAIQTYPSTVTVLTAASPSAPLTFASGSLAGGDSANQDIQFATSESEFYVKLTFSYRDLGGAVRTLTTPWKKVQPAL